MQYIRSCTKNKKPPKGWLYICKLCVVRSVDKRWNSLYLDIIRLYDGLKEIGVNPE